MEYIYAIKNLINNKVYIGSTKSPDKRKYHHFAMLKKGKHHSYHLQQSYNKHGKDKFSFYVLEECSLEDRVDRELFHIQNHQSNDRNFGYNSDSPDGTKFRKSQETKDKMSDANKTKIQVDLYTTDGILVNTFRSVNDCSISISVNSTYLHNILKGKRKSFHGYVIVRHGEPFTYIPSSKARDMSKFRK